MLTPERHSPQCWQRRLIETAPISQVTTPFSLDATRHTTAPLVVDSARVLEANRAQSYKSNLAVATWPKYTHGKRLLILAAGPDVPSTLAQSCSNLQLVEGEVQRALAKRGLNLQNGAYLLYKELVAGFDGCTLVTNNPTLLSFLLVSCPSLGSPGRLRHTKGLTIIARSSACKRGPG